MTNSKMWRSAIVIIVVVASLMAVIQPARALNMTKEEIDQMIRDRIAELRELCADKKNPNRKRDCKKLENILKWFKEGVVITVGSGGPAIGYQYLDPSRQLFGEAVSLRQLWYDSGYTESNLKKKLETSRSEIFNNVSEEQLWSLFSENNYGASDPKSGPILLSMGAGLSSVANSVVLQTIRLHMQAPDLIYDTDDKRLAAVIQVLAGTSGSKTSYTECSFGSKIGYCSSSSNVCYCKSVFDFNSYNRELTKAQERINLATNDTELKKAYSQAFSLMAGYLKLAKPYLSE